MLNATFNISVIWGGGIRFIGEDLLEETGENWRKLPQVTDRLYPNILGLRYSNDIFVYVRLPFTSTCAWFAPEVGQIYGFLREFQLHQIVNLVGKVQL